MRTKKNYIVPTTEVVDFETSYSLLESSGEQSASKSATMEDASLSGFDSSWE